MDTFGPLDPVPEAPQEDRLEEVRRLAAGEPCPLCGGRRRKVRWFCDRNAHECFFVVACEECGDVRLA